MNDERKPKSKADDVSFQDAMTTTLDQIDRMAERAIKDIEEGRVTAFGASMTLQSIRSMIGMLTLPELTEEVRNSAVPHIIWDGEHGRFGCVLTPVLRAEDDEQ